MAGGGKLVRFPVDRTRPAPCDDPDRVFTLDDYLDHLIAQSYLRDALRAAMAETERSARGKGARDPVR